MSTRMVDRLVAATLYEGYILYPYRPSSVKNQVRWTFGGVHPRAWSEASAGSDPWFAQTECLLRGDDAAAVTVHVRFRGWEEATEIDIDCGSHDVASLMHGEVVLERSYVDHCDVEPLHDDAGLVVGALIRDTEPLDVEVSLEAYRLSADLTRVRVVVRNGFGRDLASMLVADVEREIAYLEAHGGQLGEARSGFRH